MRYLKICTQEGTIVYCVKNLEAKMVEIKVVRFQNLLTSADMHCLVIKQACS